MPTTIGTTHLHSFTNTFQKVPALFTLVLDENGIGLYMKLTAYNIRIIKSKICFV